MRFLLHNLIQKTRVSLCRNVLHYTYYLSWEVLTLNGLNCVVEIFIPLTSASRALVSNRNNFHDHDHDHLLKYISQFSLIR